MSEHIQWPNISRPMVWLLLLAKDVPTLNMSAVLYQGFCQGDLVLQNVLDALILESLLCHGLN